MLPGGPATIRIVAGAACLVTSVAMRALESRRLLGLIDDPLLPERLLASRRRSAVVSIFCAGALAGLAPSLAAISVPLLLVANAAAGFRFRRALYEETWAFPGFLWFFVRLILAVYGFWIALIALPWSAGAFGTRSYTVPLAIGVVLVLWDSWYAAVFRALIGARPISDPELVAAFERLLARTSLPSPRFDVVTPRGGSVTNALALPSLRRASVIFSAPLLARLQFDEIVAICAHELAHLEYYDRKRLTGFRRVNQALIVAGALLVPAVGSILPHGFAGVLWLLGVVCAIAWRARHRQKNETASDLRAIELTGAPDALARGLTRLHHAARLPRRYDAELEQRATHPSLARRIRDIYTAAGFTPVPLGSSTVVSDASGSTQVTFGPDALVWSAGASEHRLGYSTLGELRVALRRSGGPLLVAADREGRKWELPLTEPDVVRVQAVLDQVDGQLGAPAVPRPIQNTATRTLAIACAAVSLLAGQFACAFVAVLAGGSPTSRLLSAAGAAATVASAVLLQHARVDDALVFLLMSAGLLGFAFARRNAPAEPRERAAAWSLALGAALALGLVLLAGTRSFRIHESARAFPGTGILLVAYAAALRVPARRLLLRYATIAIAGTGLALTFAGSDAFLSGFVDDPLLVRAPQITPAPLQSAPVATTSVPFIVGDVTLSPSGDAVMLWREEDDDHDDGSDWTMEVGPVPGPRERMNVDDAVFVANGDVLSVRFRGDHAEVAESAGGAAPSWRVDVEGIVSGRIALTPDGRGWTLSGWDRRQRPVRASGVRGTTTHEFARWPGVAGLSYAAQTSLGSDAIVLEKHYFPAPIPRSLIRWLMPLMPYRTAARVWHLSSPETTQLVAESLLDVNCADGAASGQLVCTAYDGTRTRVSAIAIASGRILPLTVLPGRFMGYEPHPSAGWLSGWQDNHAVALRLDSLDAFTLERGTGTFVRGIFGSGTRLAVVRDEDAHSAVEIYSAPPRK